MAKILVVEDEAVIAEALRAYLENEGHLVSWESKGLRAREILEKEDFDLIILDLMLPGLKGEELCRHIRKRSNVPILMLTAKADETSLLYGFRIGADDYMTKPFSPRELVVRAGALLRRSGGRASADTVYFGDGRFEVRLKSRKLLREDSEIHLTPIEFDLLEKLLSQPGRVFSREEIILSVLGSDFEGTDRTVDSHIRNLRSKIELDTRNPVHILTSRGRGFYFHG